MYSLMSFDKCIYPSNNHRKVTENIFNPKEFPSIFCGQFHWVLAQEK